MSRRARPARGLLTLLLAALPLATAAAQEPPPPPPGPFDLRPRWSEGERCEGEARLLLKLKVRLKLEGDPQRPLDRTSEQAQALLRRWQDEVLKVEGDRPLETRRRYSEDYEGLREPGARVMERKPAPLHQRKLVLDRDEQQRPRARLVSEPPVEKAVLDEERQGERYEAVLPPEPVAVGASWTIEGQALREALGGGLGEKAEGLITCTLRAVAEEALDEETPKEWLALIDLAVKAAGTQGSEADAPRIETELTGTLRFSLARRKVVALELKGTAHVSQVRRDGAISLTVDGKGPLELTKRYWFPERPKKGDAPPEDPGMEPPPAREPGAPPPEGPPTPPGPGPQPPR